MCQARTRFDPAAMLAELIELARCHISAEPLRKLVEAIVSANREKLLSIRRRGGTITPSWAVCWSTCSA